MIHRVCAGAIAGSVLLATTILAQPGGDRAPTGGGWTPLMIAAAEGDTAVVKKLVASGAPVDQRNERGRTALLFAAWYNHLETAAVLVEAGADPEAADVLGQTPLGLAQLKAAFDMIHLLERNARRPSP